MLTCWEVCESHFLQDELFAYFSSPTHRWKSAGTSSLYVILFNNERGIIWAALPHWFRRRSPSLQIRLCSLSHFCPPENVLFPVVFALAPVTFGRVSSFFLLSLLLFSTHPLRPCTFLAALLLIRCFLLSSHCLDWKCLSLLHSGRFFFGPYVKVLSVASWNYLGAKLIALDPTSHCNRLSANLGFSRCSQVWPRRWLHLARLLLSRFWPLPHTPELSIVTRQFGSLNRCVCENFIQLYLFILSASVLSVLSV